MIFDLSHLNSVSRKDKERLLAYFLDLKEHRDKNKLIKFKPNPGFQERFLQSFKKVRLCLVGNQEGKTTVSAYEVACWALNCHPYKQIRVPNVGWYVTAKPLKEGVEKEILPKFCELVGSDDIIDIKKNSQGIPYKIIWRTGSVTYMLSAEQDDKVFEGSTIDYAAFDEPMRRHIYIATRRGLMKAGGHLWWAMTPLDEPWVYDELYCKAKGGHKDIQIFEGESGENAHVSKEERDSFRDTLYDDEVDTRIHGKFRHLSGRVIKKYDPDRHRVAFFDIPRHWPVWLSIDPHRRKPHAALFLACAPTEVFYVCNEVFLDTTIKEFGLLCLDLMSQYNMMDQLIDTSAQEDGWDKASAREILENCVDVGVGLKTRLAQKKGKLTSGLMMINQYYHDDRLLVMDNCRRTHREQMLHVYRKSRSGDKVLEQPEDRFNDMIANLRYIFAERPSFHARAQIKQQNLPGTYSPDSTRLSQGGHMEPQRQLYGSRLLVQTPLGRR